MDIWEGLAKAVKGRTVFQLDERGPKPRIFMMTWGIPEELGELTSGLFRRADSFAEFGGWPVDVLTLAPDVDLLQADRVLKEAGFLRSSEVRVRNLFAEMAEAPISELVERDHLPMGKASSASPDLLKADGSSNVLRRDKKGRVLQADRFRADGSRWLSDVRDVKKLGRVGGRLITLFDEDERPVAQWDAASDLYLTWLDLVLGGEEAVLINDSQLISGFLHLFQRPHVATVQVMHESYVSLQSGEGHGVFRAPVPVKNAGAYSKLIIDGSQKAQSLDETGTFTTDFGVVLGACVPNISEEPSWKMKPGHGMVSGAQTGQKVLETILRAAKWAQQSSPELTLTVTEGKRINSSKVAAKITEFFADDFIHLQPATAEPAASFLVLGSSAGERQLLVDAMARGQLPVIVDDGTAGHPDLVRDGVDGFIVADGDVEALAQVMQQIAAMTGDELVVMGEAAQRRLKDFDEASLFDQWAEELKGLRPPVTTVSRADSPEATIERIEIHGEDQILLHGSLTSPHPIRRSPVIMWEGREKDQIFGRFVLGSWEEHGEVSFFSAKIPTSHLEQASGQIIDFKLEILQDQGWTRLRLSAGAEFEEKEQASEVGPVLPYATNKGNFSISLEQYSQRRKEQVAKGTEGTGIAAPPKVTTEAKFFHEWLQAPITENSVVWESFHGNGALCSPEAIFRQVLSDPAYAHLNHTWALSERAADDAVVQEFHGDPRVRFVLTNTWEYFRTLETAKYLVNNSTFPHKYIKRDGQIYLNTWHGTPLKKMGYDIEGGVLGARNILRNFMSADYLLSQNSFMTEQMYRSAYRLDNVFEGAVIEAGHPRADSLFDAEMRSEVLKRLSQKGVDVSQGRTLVYAPTWRGDDFHNPDADRDQLLSVIDGLRNHSALRGWNVWLKAHQAVYEQLADDPDFEGVLIPNQIPTNEVLAAVDLLVSDYSSVFVDFLATGRPVAFHIPDLEQYQESRGLYWAPESLPGPVSTTTDALAENVIALATHGLDHFPPEREKYRKMAEDLTASEDGGASRRVIDVVFGGDESAARVRRGFTDGRKKLFIYMGGMITNGITTSALSLVNSLDLSRFDVSVLYYNTKDADRLYNQAKLPKEIRHVIRDQGGLHSLLEESQYNLLLKDEDPASGSSSDQSLWSAEWQRIAGHSKYDAIIDFSGYSSYWNRILAAGKAQTKAVWLHNDLSEEVLLREQHRRNLLGVFRLYSYFDKLVSVSESLSQINLESLSDYASSDRFTSARNTIDYSAVYSGSGYIRTTELAVSYSELAKRIIPPDPSENSRSHHVLEIRQQHSPRIPTQDLRFSSLTEAVGALSGQFDSEELADEVRWRKGFEEVVKVVSPGKTFVAVGRLSPEKNHARLLEAFASILSTDDQARLIILGDGPLRDELKGQALRLGIGESVHFAGRLNNPYLYMAAADCFVMSSDYEGQPMTIIEARILGLPIITTAFGSVRDALKPEEGLIVPRTAEALAEGMRSYLRGELKPLPFDPERYNREVLAEFEKAVFA